MKKLMIIFCAGLIAACNDNATTTETSTATNTQTRPNNDDKKEEKIDDDAPKKKPVEKGIAGCYLKVVQRDTIFLKLIQDGKNVVAQWHLIIIKKTAVMAQCGEQLMATS